MGFFKKLSIVSSSVLIIYLSCFTAANASCCGGFYCASDSACSRTRDDRTNIISMDPLSPVRTMPQMSDKMVRRLEEAMKFAGSRDRPAGEVRAPPQIEEIWSFPGVQKSDVVEVSVEDDVLTIERNKNEETGVGKYETRYKLPDNFVMDGIVAKTDTGYLKITIPKTKRKIIEVK